MIRAKTIQIYLPDGNPRSVRIAEITSRTVQAVLVPRSQLKFIAGRDELKNVSIYFLVGNPDEESKFRLYVGEAENCLERLEQHNRSKDFWNVAIAIISKTQYFTKTHVKYLEWFCLQQAKAAGRYIVENTVTPTMPYTPENVQADLMDYFETLKILVSTLGHPIFDEIVRPPQQEVLICQTKDLRAEGEYSEDGLVVFTGSECSLVESKSANAWIKNIRAKLLEDGILKQKDNKYLFTADYIFSSPSAAAATVLGYSANGWRTWKYSDGKTLEEVHRNQDLSDTAE